MIWADKLALVIWALLLGACFFCIPHTLTEPGLWDKIWPTITEFLLPLWLILRVIDWIVGNPGRRKRRVGYYTIDPR